MAFDRNKREKKRARKVIECEEFLGGKKYQDTHTPHSGGAYLEALKEEYIQNDSKLPFEIIAHLNTKISKVTNKDKVQLKKEIFIT